MKMNVKIKTDDGTVYESGFSKADKEEVESIRDICEKCNKMNYMKIANDDLGEVYYFPNKCLRRSVITLQLTETESELN